ncbi:Unknown protein sequence [Pseudomonas savastanoi pv. phaseolicola]|nr:Unknown protein sequence [Pseudomonas savastanoi pv. phaseolicola]
MLLPIKQTKKIVADSARLSIRGQPGTIDLQARVDLTSGP